MFGNFLYYIPVEANRLYHAENGSKEKKKLIAGLAKELSLSDYGSQDAIGKKIRIQTAAVCVMAALILLLAMAMEVCDGFDIGGDGLFAALFLTLMLVFVIVIIMAFRIVGLRRKRVLAMLDGYRPVCEHFGEHLLREIGNVCAGTIGNQESIMYIADEVKDGDAAESLAEGTCLMCGKKLNVAEITEFDGQNSAKCPCCGKTAVILESQYMSERLLENMLEYCRGVSEAEKLSGRTM